MEINKLFNKLEDEIQTTENEIKKAEETERLMEIKKCYRGDDEVISSKEMEEWIKENRKKVRFELKTGIQSLDKIIVGFREGNLVIVSAPTKQGKCFGKGTEILMSDGNIKKVEEIKNGDYVMGVDSKSKKVSGVNFGREMLYKIILRNGDNFICNESHILSLRKTGTEKIVNVSLKDYFKKSNDFKHLHKAYKIGVDFKKRDLKIEPYFLGLWLGDGNSRDVRITTADNEIVNYLKGYAKKLNLKLKKQEQKDNQSNLYSINSGNRGTKAFNLQSQLRKLNLIKNKHIPFKYLTSNKKDRLLLLAGLIDSDGYKNSDTGIIFSNKNKELCKEIVFLVRSLGFSGSLKKHKLDGQNYYKVYIGGNVYQIPLLLKRKYPVKNSVFKEVKNYSFTIEKLKVNDYYGFQVEGGLFLLRDFTVVHNTTFCRTLTKNFIDKDVKSLWLSYEEGAEELLEKFGKEIPLFYLPKIAEKNTLEWIEEKVIEAIAKFNTKVLFIDHLHFIIDLSTLGKGVNTSLYIGSILRELKKLAIKYKIIIILVSHITKTSIDKPPDLGDLRDSSFIAQESDFVIFLWRQRDKSKEMPVYLDDVLLSVQANRRNGNTGIVNLEYQKEFLLDDQGKYLKDSNGKKIKNVKCGMLIEKIKNG